MLRRSVFCALAIAFVMVTPPPVAATPIISVGPYLTPTTTDPFLVPILITGATNLISWDFDLVYDATDLQINDPAALDPDGLGRPVTEGDFFAAGAPFNILIPGFIDLDPITLDQTGLLFGVHGEYGGFAPAPSGDGTLAYVEFVKTPTGRGDSTITVANTSLVSSVPEPATMALFIGGLAALVSIRRRTRYWRTTGPLS